MISLESAQEAEDGATRAVTLPAAAQRWLPHYSCLNLAAQEAPKFGSCSMSPDHTCQAAARAELRVDIPPQPPLHPQGHFDPFGQRTIGLSTPVHLRRYRKCSSPCHVAGSRRPGLGGWEPGTSTGISKQKYDPRTHALARHQRRQSLTQRTSHPVGATRSGAMAPNAMCLTPGAAAYQPAPFSLAPSPTCPQRAFPHIG